MRAKLPAILESASTTITFSVVVSVLFYSVGAMVWPVPRSLRHERSLWLAWWSWQWLVNGVLPRRFVSPSFGPCLWRIRSQYNTHRDESRYSQSRPIIVSCALANRLQVTASRYSQSPRAIVSMVLTRWLVRWRMKSPKHWGSIATGNKTRHKDLR